MSPDRDPDSGGGDAAFPAACIDPETLGDAVARDRRTSGAALRARPSGRAYTYRDFVTTSYKAGNVLRHLGVRPGDAVHVAADPVPETVLTFYGAAQLGAVTRFGVTATDDPPRVAVVPSARAAAVDLPPGHHLAVYGDPPEDPDVTHWETEVWSENPAIHPVAVDADDSVLAAGDRTHTHRAVLAAAGRVVSESGLGPGTDVTVRGSPTDAGVVAAGLVAPILAGATIVLEDGSEAAPGPSVEIDGVGVAADLIGTGGVE